MANTIDLNVNNGSQVQFPQKVSILTAEPNIWLLIYSGIAVQRQRAEGSTGFLGIGESTSQTDAVVHVTIDRISGVLLQAATSASMANILEEETWGQWIIWSTGLSIRDNGDLVLTVNTSVTGIGDAEFWSFYYNVSAKVVLDEASISGSIRWPKNMATPRGSTHFSIGADTKVTITPPGQFPFDQITVEAVGIEGAVNSADPNFYIAPYTIRGALLGKALFVGVSPIAAAFKPGPAFGFGQFVAAQISGPNPIHLTPANRHVTGVDFEMRFLAAPK
ncbi:MAG TPA: hypothetical protein VI306_09850 [Pyrinomonadaceae bacterium]